MGLVDLFDLLSFDIQFAVGDDHNSALGLGTRR